MAKRKTKATERRPNTSWPKLIATNPRPSASNEGDEPKTYPPKPAPKVPADGSLLRQDGLPVVFVMQGGKRCPIRDAVVFTACGFGWNDITVLPRDEIYPIPIGAEVTAPSDLEGEA